MLPLEPLDDILQRRIAIDVETVPDSPLDFAVLRMGQSHSDIIIATPTSTHCTHLLLGGSDWLRETKEGQRQVDEAILVILELLLAVDDLRYGQAV